MKKIVVAILSLLFLSGTPIAIAEDSPVTIIPEGSASRTTTVQADPESGETKVTIEEAPAVYDAITGELVDPAEALGDATEKDDPESLRDEVRGKMKMLE